jgi:hypothetical protein
MFFLLFLLFTIIRKVDGLKVLFYRDNVLPNSMIGSECRALQEIEIQKGNCHNNNNNNNNSASLVCEPTIPIKRMSHVGEVSANLCG